MNNYNLKYLLKYILIGFPIILLLLSLVSYNSQYNVVLTGIETYSDTLLNLSVNNWYSDIISLLNLDVIQENSLGLIITVLPLHIFWVYLFDLILDIIVFVPKQLHNLMKKVGGHND